MILIISAHDYGECLCFKGFIKDVLNYILRMRLTVQKQLNRKPLEEIDQYTIMIIFERWTYSGHMFSFFLLNHSFFFNYHALHMLRKNYLKTAFKICNINFKVEIEEKF